ncbi:hypothetical protein A2159_03530 [Candidatus Woesebacteria bacterium RBG_13_34_9]|uniref:DUF3667 domain-containing protein n=1 Tax=Candidatus Woesebacteria bacterium RBG_13_34_9 TaxID=1802477 RepID=A0A1F7X0Z4_9BACT|nr:MAG: hypothetical protein A2159_03530 [Candidatus Woesebacteria bacterium RBG_13_34_9]
MIKLIEAFKIFNSDLTEIINKYLKGYYPSVKPQFFGIYLPVYIKTIIYSLFFLLPILFLKILFPYNKEINYFIFFILIIQVLSVFLIFLAFLQFLF